MTPLRILLADDHPLFREAVRRLLAEAPGFELVGEAADGPDCLTRSSALRPDIVLLDISMPGMNGATVALELRRAGDGAKIVALSGHTDPRFVRAMFEAGADGYVVKSASAGDLIEALRAVAGGRTYVSNAVISAVTGEEQPALHAEGVSPAVLGNREKQVLRLIAEGHRGPGIAAMLGIATGTVEVHRRNILRKLHLHSAADLTRFALRHGLLKL